MSILLCGTFASADPTKARELKKLIDAPGAVTIKAANAGIDLAAMRLNGVIGDEIITFNEVAKQLTGIMKYFAPESREGALARIRLAWLKIADKKSSFSRGSIGSELRQVITSRPKNSEGFDEARLYMAILTLNGDSKGNKAAAKQEVEELIKKYSADSSLGARARSLLSVKRENPMVVDLEADEPIAMDLGEDEEEDLDEVEAPARMPEGSQRKFELIQKRLSKQVGDEVMTLEKAESTFREILASEPATSDLGANFRLKLAYAFTNKLLSGFTALEILDFLQQVIDASPASTAIGTDVREVFLYVFFNKIENRTNSLIERASRALQELVEARGTHHPRYGEAVRKYQRQMQEIISQNEPSEAPKPGVIHPEKADLASNVAANLSDEAKKTLENVERLKKAIDNNAPNSVEGTDARLTLAKLRVMGLIGDDIMMLNVAARYLGRVRQDFPITTSQGVHARVWLAILRIDHGSQKTIDFDNAVNDLVEIEKGADLGSRTSARFYLAIMTVRGFYKKMPVPQAEEYIRSFIQKTPANDRSGAEARVRLVQEGLNKTVGDAVRFLLEVMGAHNADSIIGARARIVFASLDLGNIPDKKSPASVEGRIALLKAVINAHLPNSDLKRDAQRALDKLQADNNIALPRPNPVIVDLANDRPIAIDLIQSPGLRTPSPEFLERLNLAGRRVIEEVGEEQLRLEDAIELLRETIRENPASTTIGAGARLNLSATIGKTAFKLTEKDFSRDDLLSQLIDVASHFASATERGAKARFNYSVILFGALSCDLSKLDKAVQFLEQVIKNGPPEIAQRASQTLETLKKRIELVRNTPVLALNELSANAKATLLKVKEHEEIIKTALPSSIEGAAARLDLAKMRVLGRVGDDVLTLATSAEYLGRVIEDFAVNTQQGASARHWLSRLNIHHYSQSTNFADAIKYLNEVIQESSVDGDLRYVARCYWAVLVLRRHHKATSLTKATSFLEGLIEKAPSSSSVGADARFLLATEANFGDRTVGLLLDVIAAHKAENWLGTVARISLASMYVTQPQYDKFPPVAATIEMLNEVIRAHLPNSDLRLRAQEALDKLLPLAGNEPAANSQPVVVDLANDRPVAVALLDESDDVVAVEQEDEAEETSTDDPVVRQYRYVVGDKYMGYSNLPGTHEGGAHATHSRPWLGNPSLVLPLLRVAEEDNNNVHALSLFTNRIAGTLLTLDPNAALNEQRITFVFPGRGEGAHVPIEDGVTGRIVLIVPEGPADQKESNLQKYRTWVSQGVDVFIVKHLVDSRGRPIPADKLGLITSRRIASFQLAQHWKLKHFVALDDNVENFYLDNGLPATWAEVYDLLGQLSARDNMAALSVRTYEPKIDKNVPFNRNARSVANRLGSKIFYFNAEQLFAAMPGQNPSRLLPSIVDVWGEDVFFLLYMREKGLEVGIASRKTILLTRARSAERRSAQKSMRLLAPAWLKIELEEGASTEEKNVYGIIKRIVAATEKKHAKKLAELQNRNLAAEAQKRRDEAAKRRANDKGKEEADEEPLVLTDSEEETNPRKRSRQKDEATTTFGSAEWSSAENERLINELLAEQIQAALFSLQGSDLLFPHQINAIKSLLLSLGRNEEAAVFDLATGTGKTEIFLTLIAIAMQIPEIMERNIALVVPTIELVNQSEGRVLRFNERMKGVFHIDESKIITISIDHTSRKLLAMNKDIVQAKNGGHVIIFCQDSFKDFLLEKKAHAELFSLFIVDELHECPKGLLSDLKAYAQADDALVYGFSATPGEKAKELAEEPIFRYSTKEAVRDGFLSPWFIESLGPYSKERAQQFLVDAPEFMQTRWHIVGGRISEEKGLFFTRTIKEADATAERLRAAGINAQSVHNKLKKQDRADLLKEFCENADSKVRYLVAVDTCKVGFDAKGLTVMFFPKRVHNINTWIQWRGRLLREGRIFDVNEAWEPEVVRAQSHKIAHIFAFEGGLPDSDENECPFGDDVAFSPDFLGQENADMLEQAIRERKEDDEEKQQLKRLKRMVDKYPIKSYSGKPVTVMPPAPVAPQNSLEAENQVVEATLASIRAMTRLRNWGEARVTLPGTPNDGDCAFHAAGKKRLRFVHDVRKLFNDIEKRHSINADLITDRDLRFMSLMLKAFEELRINTIDEWYELFAPRTDGRQGRWVDHLHLRIMSIVYGIIFHLYTLDTDLAGNIFVPHVDPDARLIDETGDDGARKEIYIAHVMTFPIGYENPLADPNHYERILFADDLADNGGLEPMQIDDNRIVYDDNVIDEIDRYGRAPKRSKNDDSLPPPFGELETPNERRHPNEHTPFPDEPVVPGGLEPMEVDDTPVIYDYHPIRETDRFERVPRREKGDDNAPDPFGLRGALDEVAENGFTRFMPYLAGALVLYHQWMQMHSKGI